MGYAFGYDMKPEISLWYYQFQRYDLKLLNMDKELYSISKPRRTNVTGAANQVFEFEGFKSFAAKDIRVGNVTAIYSLDVSGNWLHIYSPCPWIYGYI